MNQSTTYSKILPSDDDNPYSIENEKLIPHHQHQHQDEESPTTTPTSNLHISSKHQLLPRTPLSFFSSIFLTALITTLMSVLTIRTLNPPLPNPGTQFGTCGNTSTTALSQNCIFDPLSFSWLPRACADQELTSEFLSLKDWSWYQDENKTSIVTLEEVMEGTYEGLFVTREYHMYHCTYMWKKFHRGVMKGQDGKGRGVVDSYIGKYGHTTHCEMMLLGPKGFAGRGEVDKDVTDTVIQMKFPRCMWV